MHRAEEIRRIAEAHRASGGMLYLITLTLPHDQGDRLEPLYEAVADSYRRVHSGTSWQREKERIGYVGEIRALEATVGVNGWHPHLHVLLFTSRRMAADELTELQDFYYRRWCASITRFGYGAPTAEHGVTIVESHKDDYLAKMCVGDELTKGVGKSARQGSRTPFNVLADFAETGEVADRDLWREWVLAMHGARQLTWSRGLRERFSKEPERSDVEIVSESEGAEELVAVMSPETWRKALISDTSLMWRLLDAAEAGGKAAVGALLLLRLVK